MRAAYDAGRVVGTGVGNYFEAGRAPESPGLAARWAARQAVSIPAVRQRADLRVRWPFVFLAGNVSGFFVTVIALRLALGHPLN